MQLHRNGSDYYCPVDDCGKKCKSAATLRRHYQDVKLHSVEEMLEQGLPVWYYRKNTRAMVKDTLDWLVGTGYLQHRNPKRRPVVVEDYRQGSVAKSRL